MDASVDNLANWLDQVMAASTNKDVYPKNKQNQRVQYVYTQVPKPVAVSFRRAIDTVMGMNNWALDLQTFNLSCGSYTEQCRDSNSNRMLTIHRIGLLK